MAILLRGLDVRGTAAYVLGDAALVAGRAVTAVAVSVGAEADLARAFPAAALAA